MNSWNWKVWGAALALSWAMLDAPALAQGQLSYTLSSQGSGSYEALVQQAELAARDLVQRSFAESPGLTEVAVRISGEHNGLEAPLLYLTISRDQWQRNPDIRSQARYFGRSSAVLLGLLPSGEGVAIASVPRPTFDQVAASLTDREPNFYE